VWSCADCGERDARAGLSGGASAHRVDDHQRSGGADDRSVRFIRRAQFLHARSTNSLRIGGTKNFGQGWRYCIDLSRT